MDKLKAIAGQIGKQSNPPVHLWKPERVGEIDIRIDSQGRWFHQGGLIRRTPLVRLFASILWFENGQHFLVTPVEKLAIEVEDSPFVIHQMEQVDNLWVAVTNIHEQLIIGQEHPVELRQYQQQWVPYVRIRYQLWARLDRSTYYQWITEAMDRQGENAGIFALCSGDYQFEVSRLVD